MSEESEYREKNTSIPAHDDVDEEINLLIKERKIFSSNNREKLLRSIQIDSSRKLESINDRLNQSINHTVNTFCLFLEKIIDIVTVPRKLAFVFMISLAFRALISDKRQYSGISGPKSSNPYHGNIVKYYKPETFSSSSVIKNPMGNDDIKMEIIQGVEKEFLNRESSTPIPRSLESITDVLDLPVKEKDIPFYFHIPRAGGSTVKDILGSCYGLVGATDVGSRGKDMVNATKLEVITTREGSKYVNVDTTTLEGIEEAKELKLVESGLVDYVVTQRLHAASELFTEDHKGRYDTYG